MTLNLKALGLALVAALAMSAVVTATASAATGHFTAAEYPVHLHGEDYEFTEKEKEEGLLNAFTTPSISETGVECNKTTYTTPEINGETNEITVTPTYEECSPNVTVDMTECDYKFYGTNGGVDIECPEGKHIDVNTYLGGSHGFRICKTTVWPQTGLGTATYTNGGDGTVVVEGTIKNIEYTWDGLCNSGEEETHAADGEYHFKVKMAGTNEEGNPVTIDVG